ncbi:MAG: hypothetical protein Q9M10_02115, partial [Mariprofundaceae bacterium]|nr:hypothetical protein [Mariprofundaceae bacterium]
ANVALQATVEDSTPVAKPKVASQAAAAASAPVAKANVAPQATVATQGMASPQIPAALFQNESENSLLNQKQVSAIKKPEASSEVLTQSGLVTR